MISLFKRAYASFAGYFWLPCRWPGCGKMFGGFEAGTNRVPNLEGGRGTFWMVCKAHDHEPRPSHPAGDAIILSFTPHTNSLED